MHGDIGTTGYAHRRTVDFTSAFPNRSDEQQVVQNQGEMIIATDI